MAIYSNRTCCNGLPPQNNKSKPNDTLKLTIGVFFDGTGNNKYNIDWGAKQEVIDDSYNGSYTNVALLWKAYEESANSAAKVYVEGPGTYSPQRINQKSSVDEKKLADNEGLVSSRMSDNSIENAFGHGETGIHAKISRACDLIHTKVTELCRNQRKPVKTLTLDVFGFSRGAAAARSFVSNLLMLQDGVNAKYATCLREHLYAFSSTQKFLFKKTAYDRFLKNVEIKVRFMGLFDTVSSYSPSFSFSPNFENDVNELHLKIPKLFPTVEKVIHLVAADEYRENFALTDISSALGKGREIILPGAHSDIGGGYKHQEEENIYMSDLLFNKSGKHKTGHRECRGYMSLQELQNNKWLPVDWAAPKRSLNQYGKAVTSYNSIRMVYNTYARIPLYIMYLQAQKRLLLFSAAYIGKVTFINHNEVELLNLKDMLVRKTMNGGSLYCMMNITERETGRFIKRIMKFTGTVEEKQIIESVRYRFIHLSARNTRSWIFLHPHKATKDNQREIIRG